MNVQAVQGSVTQIECDALVVNLFQGVTQPAGATGAVDAALDGQITRAIEAQRFEGKGGQTLVVPTAGRIPARAVIVAGLGEQDKLDLNGIRKASAAAARKAEDLKAARLATISHGAGIGDMDAFKAAQATVEGALIGAYSFNSFKSDPEERPLQTLLVVEQDEGRLKKITAGALRGSITGEAVNAARDLVNSPANHITPSAMAEHASDLAGRYNLELTILEREDAEKLGMGCYLGVARGSTQPPKFIVLRYSHPQADKTVAIIGKSVTFDSGGLSLKPADSMVTMKDDMSGGAAVLAAMEAVAQITPRVNVMAICPATENMPDGSAIKPGDVLRAMNGKTIEVENTDAEGRLTLADALCYAAANGADEIIDLATLTGACVVALGRERSGVFTGDDELYNRLQSAAAASGDGIWRLPLDDSYWYLIESDTADMKNTGGREAGATTAALLLKEFAGDKPWAHVDIAGPAFLKRDNGLVNKGASGAGVRLLVEYLCPPEA